MCSSGSSPTCDTDLFQVGLKITMHASSEKRRENMSEEVGRNGRETFESAQDIWERTKIYRLRFKRFANNFCR